MATATLPSQQVPALPTTLPIQTNKFSVPSSFLMGMQSHPGIGSACAVRSSRSKRRCNSGVMPLVADITDGRCTVVLRSQNPRMDTMTACVNFHQFQLACCRSPGLASARLLLAATSAPLSAYVSRTLLSSSSSRREPQQQLQPLPQDFD